MYDTRARGVYTLSDANGPVAPLIRAMGVRGVGRPATHTLGIIASIIKMEDAMTNAAMTTSDQPDIDLNDAATTCSIPQVVVKTTAREKVLQSASQGPSRVLRELALAQWRGAATQVSGPPRKADD